MKSSEKWRQQFFVALQNHSENTALIQEGHHLIYEALWQNAWTYATA